MSLQLTLVLLRAEQGSQAAVPFRVGPQEYHLVRAGGGVESLQLEWTQELLDDLAAVRLPGRDAEVAQRLGNLLRSFLQPGDWSLHEEKIVAAAEEGRPITLTLRSAAAELYALPWELLTIRSTGQHLGELPSLLLRYELPDTNTAAATLLESAEPGRILFAWSAVAGGVPAPEQKQTLITTCANGGLPFDADRDVLENASCAKLVAKLEEAKKSGTPIRVLHLLCHGVAKDRGYALALNTDGAPDVIDKVDAGVLRRLLQPFTGMVRLIVITACDSGNSGPLGNHLGSIAQVLHQIGFAQVVASRFPLSVEGSAKFTQAFYGALLERPASVEQALLEARRVLSKDTQQLDWASLQLYGRDGDGGNGRPLSFRPYRGLLAFLPEHRRYFFGRDREVAEILSDYSSLQKTAQPLLLAVDGASGTGKSSVVLAGSLPQLLALQGPNAVAIRTRPGRAPLQMLVDTLSTVQPGQRALLYIDQFEELFTHVENAEERKEFARYLWQLVSEPQLGVGCVLTIRSDFVGRCGELVLNDAGLRLDRVIYDEAHRVSIAQLDPQQMREVIEKPAALVGLALEHGLAERMIKEVDSEPGALPLLADTLDLLWLRREGGLLTQKAYDALGGVTGALHGRADQLIAALSVEEKLQARRLLVRLGSGARDSTFTTRRRLQVSSLRPTKDADRQRFDKVLSALAQARLLVLDRQGAEELVEVAHEALLRKWPLFAQWAKEDEQQMMQLDQLERWAKQWRAHNTPLSGKQLGYAEQVAENCKELLSDEVQAMLAAGRKERVAAEQRDHFARDCLLMLAVKSLDDATRKVAILREIESADPTTVPGWLETVTDIFQTHVLMKEELPRHPSSVHRAVFDKDGVRIATACGDGTVRLWPIQGGTPVVLTCHNEIIHWVEFSPSGKQIVTASDDKTAKVWDLDHPTKPLLLKGHKDIVGCAAWSPDGNMIATACSDGLVRLFRSGNGTAFREFDGKGGQVGTVAWNTSSTQIVAAFENGTALVWNVEGHGRPQKIDTQDEGACAAAFSLDDECVAVAMNGGYVIIEELANLGQPQIIQCGSAPLHSIAWSKDSSRIVAACDDGVAYLMHTAGSKMTCNLTGHTHSVYSAVFSPDGNTVLTASVDMTVRLWNAARPGLYTPMLVDGKMSNDSFLFAVDPDQEVRSEVRSRDGKQSITFLPDRTATIKRKDGTTTKLPAHPARIVCATFNKEGDKVITGAADWKARIWNCDGTGSVQELDGHRGVIVLVAMNPDGDRILTMSMDSTTRIYWLDGRSELLIGPGSDYSIAVRRDFQQFITGMVDDEGNATRLLWDLVLDPKTLRDRLWEATPYRLSIAERERYLRESPAVAKQNYDARATRKN